MKHITLILLLLSVTACDKNDDDSPQDPLSQLPPATMTGANTFGALLDGKPFIPSGGINPLDCVYQLINGERFFALQGNKRDEEFNRISLSLSLSLPIKRSSRRELLMSLLKIQWVTYLVDTVSQLRQPLQIYRIQEH